MASQHTQHKTADKDKETPRADTPRTGRTREHHKPEPPASREVHDQDPHAETDDPSAGPGSAPFKEALPPDPQSLTVEGMPDVPRASLNGAMAPEYDRDGRLTRLGMEQVVAQGGSVLVRGVGVINRANQLPHPEQIASSPAELDEAEASLEQQRKDLDKRLATVKERKAATKG